MFSRLTSAGSSFSWISTWLSVSGLKLSISDEIFSRAISKFPDGKKASGTNYTFSFGEKHLFYCFHFLELAFVKVVDVGRNVLSTNILTNIIFANSLTLTFGIREYILLHDFLVFQLVFLEIFYFAEKLA